MRATALQEALAKVRPRVRWTAVLSAALLAGYGAFLVRHAAFAVGGSHSSGYANTARRMKAGTLVERPRSLDRLGLPDEMAQICIPLGFLTGPKPGTMPPPIRRDSRRIGVLEIIQGLSAYLEACLLAQKTPPGSAPFDLYQI